MDDNICSKDKSKIGSHSTIINSIHRMLLFTHESEKEGRLPFLDMEIIMGVCQANGTENPKTQAYL